MSYVGLQSRVATALLHATTLAVWTVILGEVRRADRVPVAMAAFLCFGAALGAIAATRDPRGGSPSRTLLFLSGIAGGFGLPIFF